ncbi:4-(cytidine 5'-diphospho)-2-C-methyl-D-erythritol kinase [Tropicimonas isoalkanivorans]|uniref:4-(cytidine 5'-diphospho)-2-C-methyl-D-erythritol kinase n=1 Tax=Tropicimonas isoalkanivorans TaxID=441112 RepID=UPI000B86F0FC|nr:4-(cytidine 5'-diphospho)-2-C-methyl-D-erythritol kinase [Tropicimonas isoalkanivorans]
MVEEFAPAKVNLTLHVTGRRRDGYHLLDSLVVFADVGDRIIAERAPEPSFRVTGPRSAGVPTDGSNLVLRAAAVFGAAAVALTLEKTLPSASGIGGGSADAAATLRALARLYATEMPALEKTLELGADVPVCIDRRPVRMTGIGEELTPLPPLSPLPAVLVNPGVAVATPLVFKSLSHTGNRPMPEVPPGGSTVQEVAGWLARQRNDLESPACMLEPTISDALRVVRAQPECLLSRMSGSGATCFGLFPDEQAAHQAAHAITRTHPNWWVTPTILA